jgi:hypothetical protein
MLYPKVVNQIVDILNDKWPEVCMCNQVMDIWPCPNNQKCSDSCPIYWAKKSGAKGVIVQAQVEQLPFNVCGLDKEYCDRKMNCADCPKTKGNK